MILYEAPQGSPEWHAARAGVITASNVRMIRAKVNALTDQQARYVAAIRAGKNTAEACVAAGYKAMPKAEAVERALAGLPVGDWSDTALNYAFRLAVERISGKPLDEGFEGWAAERGHELEPEARALHQARMGVIVDTVGFISTDDRKFGCSVDGLIDDDGGAEYKCFLSPTKLRPILLDGDMGDVRDQCQFGMAVTGRKWWHFALYCPALQPAGKDFTGFHVPRDDDYIDAMWADLLAFEKVVTDFEVKLRAPAPERLAA